MLTIETLTAWARELGFSETGFCSLDSFVQEKQIVASQAPLSERRQLRFDPLQDHPDAKSIAVLLWPYVPARMQAEDSIFVDSYYQASNAAYHAARMLEEKLLDAGCYAKANVSYPAKKAAIRAGMGRIGRNSLLITPEYGSRIVIILMATGIELQVATGETKEISCLECGRCAKACPAGAIDEKGLSYPERCLRNFMMEGIVVPQALRSKIGMRLIGCDACQRVCPLQPVASRRSTQRYLLSEFLTDDASAFSTAAAKLSNEIGRNVARPQRIRAQAAILAGNTKDKSYLPVLCQWAQLPFEAVREHARWAIEQIESSGDYA